MKKKTLDVLMGIVILNGIVCGFLKIFINIENLYIDTSMWAGYLVVTAIAIVQYFFEKETGELKKYTE